MATLSFAPTAFAQAQPTSDEIATARALGQEGQGALDKKDFKTAEDRYGRAWKLYPQALSLGVGYARALIGNGKLVAAQEAYNKVMRGNAQGNKVFEQAIEDAKKELDALSPRISGVTITVTAAGGGTDLPNLKVTLDDAPVNTAALGVNKPVDPGAHVVKATADGYKPAEAKFAVAEGGNATTALTLEKDGSGAAVPPTVPPVDPNAPPTTPPPGAGPTPPPGGDTGPITTPPANNKTLMYVSFGVGGAGLIVGGITGILALGKKSDLDKTCTNGTCPASAQSDVDGYH